MTFKAEVRNKIRKQVVKTGKKSVVQCMACGRPAQEGKLCNKCKFWK